MREVYVKKILVRKDGIKMVIIPKESSWKKDELVRISKLEKESNK